MKTEHGSIRSVDYDGETWVNLSDMEDLVCASRERWSIEGEPTNAQVMYRFGQSIRTILG